MTGKTYDIAAVLAKVEERNPSITVEGVKFRNAALLPREDRDQLTELFKGLDGEDVDADTVVDIYGQALVLVAEDKDGARGLVERLKAEPGAVVTLFAMYGEDTQVGEA